MIMTTKFYAPAVTACGALSLSLALAAGSAQAVTVDLDIAGITETFSQGQGSTSTLSVSALSGTGEVSDGNTIPFSQLFTIDGFTNGLDETRSIDRTLSVAVDGNTQSQTLAQTARVRGVQVNIDGGGGPDNVQFQQRAALSDPAPLSFVFDGVGTFDVDVGGDSATTFFQTSSTTASGSLPVSVTFSAEAQPEPEPGPSPIPLPAGLPLLIGGLGAFAALRGLGRRS